MCWGIIGLKLNKMHSNIGIGSNTSKNNRVNSINMLVIVYLKAVSMDMTVSIGDSSFLTTLMILKKRK
jgi:hypothetical protein